MMQDKCEEYGDWMIDAALGALAPERECAFAAHIAQCEPCRKAYEQARQFAVAIDRGVESLVAGEPSPQFAARLRMRIADEQPTSRFAWLTWKPAAALALASILAVAGIVWIARHHNSTRNAIPFARAIAAVRTAPSQVSSAATPHSGTQVNSQTRSSLSARAPAEPGRTGSPPAVQPRRVAVARLVLRRHADPRANSPAEPEVIVPPGQVEAVMQLAAAIRSGRIDGKELLTAQKQMEQPLKIESIDIPPVAKPQPYLYPSDAYSSSDVAPD